MDKLNIISIARDLGWALVNRNRKYCKILNKNGLSTQKVYKVEEGRPNVVDEIKNKQINLVINPMEFSRSRYDEEAIGRSCIRHGILIATTLSGANAVSEPFVHQIQKSTILQKYHS